MRGVYTAKYRAASVNTARTLMYITAPSTAIVEILEASITEDGINTSEQLQFEFTRITSLGTPTATTVTPSPTEVGDQVAGSTVKGNVTASEPTYGTVDLDSQGVAGQAGYYYSPIPEDRDTIPPSGSLGLRLLNPSPPANTYNFIITIKFREIG